MKQCFSQFLAVLLMERTFYGRAAYGTHILWLCCLWNARFRAVLLMKRTFYGCVAYGTHFLWMAVLLMERIFHGCVAYGTHMLCPHQSRWFTSLE